MVSKCVYTTEEKAKLQLQACALYTRTSNDDSSCRLPDLDTVHLSKGPMLKDSFPSR